MTHKFWLMQVSKHMRSMEYEKRKVNEEVGVAGLNPKKSKKKSKT